MLTHNCCETVQCSRPYVRYVISETVIYTQVHALRGQFITCMLCCRSNCFDCHQVIVSRVISMTWLDLLPLLYASKRIVTQQSIWTINHIWWEQYEGRMQGVKNWQSRAKWAQRCRATCYGFVLFSQGTPSFVQYIFHYCYKAWVHCLLHYHPYNMSDWALISIVTQQQSLHLTLHQICISPPKSLSHSHSPPKSLSHSHQALISFTKTSVYFV